MKKTTIVFAALALMVGGCGGKSLLREKRSR